MSSQNTVNEGQRSRAPLSLFRLRDMVARGEKITMLTAYDASFARLIDDAGVDCLLVGDSLGMVIQGRSSTVPVSLDEMVYHTRIVAAAHTAAWLVADLPFASYHEGPAQAMHSACALMQAGAQMVKLEGGGWTTELVHYLVQRGVPVCGHLGLTPQSVFSLGGYRIQGRDDASANVLRTHARELAQAGASMLVLELMPSAVASAVQADNPSLITIGIGAGAGTAGQVLVSYDMLGITRGKLPRFVRNFMQGSTSIEDAVTRYVAAVKDGSFPDESVHGY